MTSTTAALPSFEQAIAQYDPVMGLEVHVELGTTTKLFCGCSTEFGAEPNAQVCPVCLGLPGSLPVLNRAAVESAIRLGLALNCTIAEWCRFARKNYFYPDMPKNFQISQYDEPIAYDGWLDITYEGETYRIGIERAHMEEDTGKSLHVGGTTGRIHGASYSLLDYNRSGIPLIEVVTKPIEVPLRSRPRSPGRTSPSSANWSVYSASRRLGWSSASCAATPTCRSSRLVRRGSALGRRPRTSTRSVRWSAPSLRDPPPSRGARRGRTRGSGDPALARRHRRDDVGSIQGGSRGLPLLSRARPGASRTVPGLGRRAPDDTAGTALGQLGAAAREWGFSDLEMRDVLNAGAVELVAATVAAGSDAAGAKKWWLGEIARLANERGVALDAVGITPADVARIQELVGAGTLNDKLARQVIEGIVAGEGSSDDVVSARGLAVVSDEEALAAAVDAAIAAMPEVAAKVRAGNLAAVGPLVGAVMKATRGQANAARVRELILERLS